MIFVLWFVYPPYSNLLTFNLITKFENSQIEIEITFTCLA